jgi:hypothetical protein
MERGTGRMSISRNNSESWVLWGRSLPKAEIVYFTQIFTIFIVIISCIVNLSIGNRSELWLVLLSTSLGAILPNPSLKQISGVSAIPVHGHDNLMNDV